MKWKIFGLTVIAIFVLLLLQVCGYVSWFASRTADVVQQQVDPVELLRKYEWFKDAKASLEAKQADIKVYQVKIDRLDKLESNGKLDRTNREQLMVWEQEVAGMKLSYNQLASEYNSQMAKINWRFTNRGQLPQGASEPLPREFAPYTEQ